MGMWQRCTCTNPFLLCNYYLATILSGKKPTQPFSQGSVKTPLISVTTTVPRGCSPSLYNAYLGYKSHENGCSLYRSTWMIKNPQKIRSGLQEYHRASLKLHKKKKRVHYWVAGNFANPKYWHVFICFFSKHIKAQQRTPMSNYLPVIKMSANIYSVPKCKSSVVFNHTTLPQRLH